MPEHDIDISEADGVRYLHFGSDWIQGAMRIARPWSLELEYTREMLAGLLLRPHEDWPGTCLIVGLGAASQAKFMHRHFPEARVTVLEINPGVIAAARQFFKLPTSAPRMEILITDAAQWMQTAPAAHFDLILLDGFGANGRPGPLDSEAFYLACRQALGPRGLLAVNLLSRSRGFQAAARRIAKAFAGRSMVFPSCDSGNAIAFAASGDAVDTRLETMRMRAVEIKEHTGLDLRPCISRLQLSHSLPDGHLRL